MSRKTTETAIEEAVVTAEAVITAETEENKVFVYLGPTIGGLIQSGTIYMAKSKGEIKEIAIAVSKIPKIKQLIVEDINIRTTKARLNEGNNAVSNAFREIAEEAAKL